MAADKIVVVGIFHGFGNEDTRWALGNSTGRRDKKKNKKDTELGLPILLELIR